jgi:hypothetical protein
MQQLLETLGVIKDENRGEFKMFPAILMMVLMLTFVCTAFYMLISNL